MKPTNPPNPSSYGYPPPPSVLLISSRLALPSYTQNSGINSARRSSPSTPPGPSLEPISVPVPSEPPYCANLAQYLAKNPGLKRLYNNHGSINRPACVECHKSRKKCELDRPCTRCVKYKLPCIERPPRGKRQKVDEDVPSSNAQVPCPSKKPKKSKQKPRKPRNCLPSPISEPSPARPDDAPTYFNISPALVNTLPITPPTPPTPFDSLDFNISDDILKNINIDVSALFENTASLPSSTDHHDLLDVPAPKKEFLSVTPLKLSGAPVYNLEGNDVEIDAFAKQIERDVCLDEGSKEEDFGFTHGVAQVDLDGDIEMDLGNIRCEMQPHDSSQMESTSNPPEPTLDLSWLDSFDGDWSFLDTLVPASTDLSQASDTRDHGAV